MDHLPRRRGRTREISGCRPLPDGRNRGASYQRWGAGVKRGARWSELETAPAAVPVSCRQRRRGAGATVFRHPGAWHDAGI